MTDLVAIEMKAHPRYGSEIIETIIMSQDFYDRFGADVRNKADDWGWSERAGKHSYTDCETVIIHEVNPHNAHYLATQETGSMFETLYDYTDEEYALVQKAEKDNDTFKEYLLDEFRPIQISVHEYRRMKDLLGEPY